MTKKAGANGGGRGTGPGSVLPAGRFRGVVQRINLGVTLHGPDGALLFANDAALRILATTEEALAEGPWPLAEGTINESGEPLSSEREPLRVALNERMTVSDMVLGVRRPDGER